MSRIVDIEPLLKKYDGMNEGTEFSPIHFINDLMSLEQQPSEDVFDNIKAEIIEKFDNCSICEWFEDYDYDENDISEYRWVGHISDIIDIIDKYRKEDAE